MAHKTAPAMASSQRPSDAPAAIEADFEALSAASKAAVDLHAARDIAAASNRKDECLRVCKRLQPGGGVPPRPEGKTGKSDRLAAGNPG